MATMRISNYLDTLSTYQRHSFYCYFIGAISAIVSEEVIERATDIAIEAMETQEQNAC